eukprot:3782961-Lingulodinium_polyedra.AAC.1
MPPTHGSRLPVVSWGSTPFVQWEVIPPHPGSALRPVGSASFPRTLTRCAASHTVRSGPMWSRYSRTA